MDATKGSNMTQELKTENFITENMTVGDVISKYPEAAEVFGKHGLSCIGCSVNTFEAVGVGARGHGMSDEQIASMLKEANETVAKKASEPHEKHTLPTTGEVILTKVAADKILELMKSQGKSSYLKFGVSPGGCSGFTYQLEFVDAPNPDDIVMEKNGVKIAVSPQSMEKVNGVQIDFVDGLQGSGFKISNPNSHGGCGCGKSFS